MGATALFTAVARDVSGQAVPALVTWSSSDPATISVDTAGVALALDAGTANVTASIGSVQSAPVAVSAAPLTGIASVALSPATLDLAVNETAQLAVRAFAANGDPIPLAIRQVAWSTSDPSIARAAGGVAVGNAAGAATLVASVNGVQSGPLTVTVVDPVIESGGTARTSAGKIAEALQAGTITDEQALVYRVYDAFGSPQLPAQFQGEILPALESGIRLDVANRYAGLSAQAKAQVLPYLTPPIYPGSWGDPAFAVAQRQGFGRASRPFDASQPTCVSGGQAPLPGWGRKVTAHFNFWYRTVVDPDFLVGSYTAEEAELAAANLARHAEEIWAAETAYMGRVPLPDDGLPCNGGSGALDVYVDRRARSRGAETIGYSGVCKGTPSWTWIAPDFTLDEKTARDVLAHEFLHMIQFSYPRAADCGDYLWLDEAGATWIIDYVYHPDQFEQTEAFTYLCRDNKYPIEQADPSFLLEGINNGYQDYLLLQYLANGFAQSTVRQIFDFTQATDSLDAVANGVGAVSAGLDDVWPKFAAAQWNDFSPGGILHSFKDWDDLGIGVRACLTMTNSNSKQKPVEVKMKPPPDYVLSLGPDGEAKFDINVFIKGGGFSFTTEDKIPHMSATYVDLKMVDDSVRSLVYVNKPVALVGFHPKLRIQALKKVGGAWQGPEDWTHEPFKTFCRDAAAERLEELVVIYSNSSIEDDVMLEPEGSSEKFDPEVDVSNAGCWQWKGTAKVTSHSTFPTTATELITADVTFDRDRSLIPAGVDVVGHDLFKSSAGTVTYSLSGTTVAGCTITIPSTSHPIASADGYIDLIFDQPKQPGDRTALSHGGTTMAVTETVACPDGTQTSDTNIVANWLAPPVPLTLSSDGQSLTGSATVTDPAGNTQTYEWDLAAQRE